MRSDAKTSRVFFGRGGKLLRELGTGANRAQHRYVAQTKQTVFREHRRSYKRRMLCREEKTQSEKLRTMKYFSERCPIRVPASFCHSADYIPAYPFQYRQRYFLL